MYLFLFALALLIPVLLRLKKWLHNYQEARLFNLPILLLPVSHEDVWWLLLRPMCAWVEKLPFGLGSWYIYTEMGWPTVDGRNTTERLGENFIICSPKSVRLITCYEPAVSQTCRDMRSWSAPDSQSQLFAFFGQNVSSTNGDQWQRHRKIVGSAFNEPCMREVWRETGIKASELKLHDKSYTLGGIRSTFDVVAMKVLAIVAFGQETELEAVTAGHQQSFMQSLGFILRHVILTVAFQSLKAPEWLLPKTLKQLQLSIAEFRLYMQEIVHREMQTSANRKTLLSTMVAANESEKQEQKGRPSFLTDSELYGNLFVFNLAGYETTASSLAFALPYMAAYPEAQEWVREEVDAMYVPGCDYADTYPRLVRCLAWMYEVLRLASPAPLLVRKPEYGPQTVPVLTPSGPSEVTIKSGMIVGWNLYGGHLSSRWGSDALEFNPKRFIEMGQDGAETIKVPAGVLFLPWITGPRVCPGKKFSQVEFVALIANILSRYRVQVHKQDIETTSQARARLLRVMDEKYFSISTHFKRPADAAVEFVARDS